MPPSTVAVPAPASIDSTPLRAERSISTPSVAHNGVKECPAPAGRTVRPSRSARATVSCTAASSAGVTVRVGEARTLPDQLRHSVIEDAAQPAGSLLRPPVDHHEAVSDRPSTLPRGWSSSNTRL